MRLTKIVRGQLVAFVVLAVASLTFALVSYLDLPRMLGFGTYTVTASFSHSADLYENAIVTYRGTDIGKIAGIRLSETGVDVDLTIDKDVQVPADLTVEQHSTSAVGEQYIDLVPKTASGPFLRDGSRIPVGRTSSPTSTGDLLQNVNGLLATLPKGSLKTVIDESYDAFSGSGPILDTLLDAAGPLVDQAQANIGPTTKLIKDLGPLLDTGDRVAPEIKSFTHDLASFTDQLVMSDGQIRAVLDEGPGFAAEADRLFTDLTPTIPVLMANLQTVGQVLKVNLPGVRQVLTVYPALSAAIASSHKGFQQPGSTAQEPQGPLDFKIPTVNLPQPCTEGFEDIKRRDPSDLSSAEPSTTAYCKVPPSDPRAVRGARNAPCATDPEVRTGEVADCPRGLPSTWPEMLAKPGGAPAGSQTEVPYDPATGRFFAPDGRAYVLDDIVGTREQGKEARSWQDLMLAVVGK
jgi:phospholipid/cholesterol/gamma-HCH transport system substrate-binding protein